MAETIAPGLTADWLNGWLAAIGITVLVPDVRLSWTSEPVPKALFTHSDGGDLASHIHDAWITEESLDQAVIAPTLPDAKYTLGQSVPLATYQERAIIARKQSDTTLSSSVTDLVTNINVEKLPHSAFEPGAPGTVGGQYKRVKKCLSFVPEKGRVAKIDESLNGYGERVVASGLGFDYRRIQAAPTHMDKVVDPVVEVLAFAGIQLFPIRGDGQRYITRGWHRTRGTGPRHFYWPIWTHALDCWSIDALLDRFYIAVNSGRDTRSLRVWTISGCYRSVDYRTDKGSKEQTAGYASERVW